MQSYGVMTSQSRRSSMRFESPVRREIWFLSPAARGSKSRVPTGERSGLALEARFSRQQLVFGDTGQRAISGKKVGIVGLGGLGTQITQALAHLGVGSFVLVDDDKVEASNLNRL